MAIYNATDVPLQGTLCYCFENNSNPCIWLKNGSVGNWLDPLTDNHIPLAMLAEALQTINTGASSGTGSGKKRW